MFVDPITQWVFTAIFVFLTLYSVAGVVRDRRTTVPLVGHLLHAGMSVDMAAMSWPWWARLPWLVQVIFFAGATVWYLVLAGMTARFAHLARGYAGGPAHQLMHALMMAAMTWMVAAMAPSEGGSSEAHVHHVMGAGTSTVGILLTAGLLIAGALSATTTSEWVLRRRSLSGLGCRDWRAISQEGASTVMNFGMAAMCVLMLAM